MQDREVRADAILKNLPEQALEDLWRMRYPEEEDGEKMTLEAICVEIPRLYNVSCSMGALSNFYKWLRFKRRMDSGKRLAQQVAEEMLDSGMSVEKIHETAQYAFTHRTLDTDDPKLFIQFAKLQLEAEKVRNESRRIDLLEKKAERLDKAESDIAAIRENKTLSEEQQRVAILDKMDEFFGLKKR